MKKYVLPAVLTALLGGCASYGPYGDGRNRFYGNRADFDAPGAYYDDRRYYGHERRLRGQDYVYRGRDGRYYCRRNNGDTGLVVGGVGGAIAGGAIGGDVLGALIGAGAGALLGREVERSNNDYRCR